MFEELSGVWRLLDRAFRQGIELFCTVFCNSETVNTVSIVMECCWRGIRTRNKWYILEDSRVGGAKRNRVR